MLPEQFSILIICRSGESRIEKAVLQLGLRPVLVNMSEIIEKTKDMIFGIGTAIIDVESTGFAFLDAWNKLVNADNAVSIIWAVDGNMKDVVYRCFQETDEIFVSLETSAGELHHAISSSFSRYIMRKSSLQQINDLKER